MDNGNVFRVAASDCVEQTQLADAKGRNNGRDAFDPSITIGGISFAKSFYFRSEHHIVATCVELIDIAHPIEANFGNII